MGSSGGKIGATIGGAFGGPIGAGLGYYAGSNLQGGKTGGPGIYDTTPGGSPYNAYLNKNPFTQQLLQSGLYEQGFFAPNFLTGTKTQAGGALGALQDSFSVLAGSAYLGDQFLNTFGPQQIETQGKLAQKDIETLSQLPQYKDFFNTQNQLQQTAQSGLAGLGGGFGEVPGAVDQQLGNYYAQGVSRLGLQGSPLGANQGGTAYAATKAQLGEQFRNSRINQALGIQQGFRMPGSLLGAVSNPTLDFSQAYNIYQGFGQKKALEQQRRDQINAGYGSLLGGVLNTATAALI